MTKALSALLFISTASAAPLMGGFRKVESSDLKEGAKMYEMATFAFSALQATCETEGANSIACNTLKESDLKVEGALQQVVSGMNYVFQLTLHNTETNAKKADVLLKVYEQSWTKTLKITSATVTLPPQGASLVLTTMEALEKELDLDFKGFMDAFAPNTEVV
mmetsp:Transcript_21925/g.49462  ORF Transcript_21925/g.49462 Transcript_21925/m.49462 type:complete len:163 (-) Transcript_21925:567-1055(-)|eukprot:CAMPEP_0181194256 /NCGR_PEP_ID=MMETSP1096-20121128/14242_1 /TAXON_ID=156174 ORGANISM="Chrysochromulina ericina, Strain CCMP281" /NCGR_SAMPLE_ID=MMETSP1096 /ASSEMBLY_ACC=CAM_ASM_000453 /LENGTH=162 /DNA_ID=CAMNT_0023283751 /DNA_START=18 /DNA_END=506 /DNA_ORIENTATION=+